VRTRNGEKDFHYPVCGSTEYDENVESNGIMGPGGASWVASCSCRGCGVLFIDPEKFSRARKDPIKDLSE
jgi:hypothetical protein